MEQYSPNLGRRNPTCFQERIQSLLRVEQIPMRDRWPTPISPLRWTLGPEHRSDDGQSSLGKVVAESMADAKAKRAP